MAFAAYERRLGAEESWKAARAALRKAKSLLQMEELKCRKRVLRRLGYADTADVISAKGRVACEISAADELVLTELLFNDAFSALSGPDAAALLSAFVFQENAEAGQLSEQLQGILRQMQETARRIAKVSREAKLEGMEEEAYVDKFKPHIMEVVKAWATGSSFKDICGMTTIFEGSIIRAMRRLEELLREMVGAAKAIGNADLEQKFAQAISGKLSSFFTFLFLYFCQSGKTLPKNDVNDEDPFPFLFQAQPPESQLLICTFFLQASSETSCSRPVCICDLILAFFLFATIPCFAKWCSC